MEMTGTTGVPMAAYVVRVWLPDRPGALGQVAGRIGAVRGDVVGIDILERGGGRVIDELVVAMPADTTVGALVASIAQVEGVDVEDVQRVVGERHEPGLAALDLAGRVAATAPGERVAVLCDGVSTLFDADWVSVIDPARRAVVRTVGHGPDPAWLAAFVDGSRHLAGDWADGSSADDSDPDDSTAARPEDSAPGELAWAPIESVEQVLVFGRAKRPVRSRERRQLSALCRLTSSLLDEPSQAR